MQSNLPPSAAKYCHQVQSYAAIQCNGVLPPSAITKGCPISHPRRRRAVAQPRFDQDVVGVRHWRVRCGLPTIQELLRIDALTLKCFFTNPIARTGTESTGPITRVGTLTILH